MAIVSSIPLATIPGFSKLVGDYMASSPALRHLYKYDFNIDSFAQIIADKAKDNTDRELLVKALKKQYIHIDQTAQTAQNIEALLSPKTFTITAAHQPCVLLGPVFNIYKIASTINLVNQLKAKYPDNNFVPVFWMGSEDHDFEELGTTYIYGKKIEWPAAAGEAGAYGRRKTASFDKVLDQALEIVGEPGKALIDKLRQGLDKFPTFGAYTRYIINELFGETGLVVIDQDDAELKKRFSPIIADELKNSSAIKAIDENIKWLTSNYNAQATPRDINLFYLDENSRERIIRTADGYEVNNRGIKFSADALAELAENKPEMFSPNVILRPVYQELILPNLAFVGGAGELSYWMELKPIFEYHKVNYPMLVMRSSMSIVTSSIEKKMDKLGLAPIDFFGNLDTTISSFVKSKLSADIQFDEEKKSLASLFDSFVLKAEKVDPTLRGAVLAEKQKQQNALEAIEGKIIKAEKRKQEEAINQIRAIYLTFSPENSWQERIENFIPFYIKDSGFVNKSVEIADPFNRSMLIINSDR